ncbi:MAG: hypothetical protein H7246_14285 [Phycisphaerae bacterium]|nr:hypothetical protein [Saprospiraceae bacterium]
MKQLSTFVLLIALCYSAPVFAQNKSVVFGLFYLPVCGDNIGQVSLAYYQDLKPRHSLGIKTMFLTDAMGNAADDIRMHVINTDLVYSWHKRSLTNRSMWRLDAGISMSSIIKKIPPYNQPLECGTGMSEKDFREWEEYSSKSHTQTNLLAGITTTANWELSVTRHLGFGAGLTLNAYFSRKESPQLLPVPNLNAVYSF